jgi:hypothetical protein
MVGWHCTRSKNKFWSHTTGASSHPSKCCLGCIATGVDGDVDVDVDGWGQDEEGKVQVRGDELGLGAGKCRCDGC